MCDITDASRFSFFMGGRLFSRRGVIGRKIEVIQRVISVLLGRRVCLGSVSEGSCFVDDDYEGRVSGEPGGITYAEL